MKFEDYVRYDALGLADLVDRGEVAASELLDAAIARTERVNPALNAVVYKGYDDARRWAAGDLPDGPFKGVPFLIKDLGAQVKGWPRSSGSNFAQVPADADDSELVRRYRAAGAGFPLIFTFSSESRSTCSITLSFATLSKLQSTSRTSVIGSLG